MSNDLPQTFAADQRQLGLEWLRISIERFRANIKKQGIGGQDLYNSFVGSLVGAAGGDELRLRLAYAIQGMYVDMGVGRGKRLGDEGRTRNELRNSRGRPARPERRAKRWYAKQMSRETKALGELYSALVGQTMVATAGAALPQEPIRVDLQ